MSKNVEECHNIYQYGNLSNAEGRMNVISDPLHQVIERTSHTSVSLESQGITNTSYFGHDYVNPHTSNAKLHAVLH